MFPNGSMLRKTQLIPRKNAPKITSARKHMHSKFSGNQSSKVRNFRGVEIRRFGIFGESKFEDSEFSKTHLQNKIILH